MPDEDINPTPGTADDASGSAESPGAGAAASDDAVTEMEGAMLAAAEAAVAANTPAGATGPTASDERAATDSAIAGASPPPDAAEAGTSPSPAAPRVHGDVIPVPDFKTTPFEPPALQEEEPDATSGIELLDDVELDVRIELGRTEMFVEDVLKLGVGSVVPLDKLAGDPVDVYVNEQLVARGEVLVLNDNFCVRINDIVSPVPESGGAR